MSPFPPQKVGSLGLFDLLSVFTFFHDQRSGQTCPRCGAEMRVVVTRTRPMDGVRAHRADPICTETPGCNSWRSEVSDGRAVTGGEAANRARAMRAIRVTVPRGTYRVRRADADDFMRRHLREPDHRAP